MCEPVTIAAIVAASASAISTAGAAAATAGTAIATAASAAGSAVATGLGTVGSLLGGTGTAGSLAAGGTAGATGAVAPVGTTAVTLAATPAATTAAAAVPSIAPAATGVLGTGFTGGEIFAGATTLAGVVSGTVSGVQSEQAAQAADDASEDKAKLETSEAARELSEAGEVASQKRFELARSALAQRSVAQNSGLSEKSVLALARSADFQAGLDKTTVDRNLEIKQQKAAAQLRGVRITRATEKAGIGGTSTTRLVASIGGAGVRSIGTGLQIARTLDRT